MEWWFCCWAPRDWSRGDEVAWHGEIGLGCATEVTAENSQAVRLRCEVVGEYMVSFGPNGQRWKLCEHAAADGGKPALIWSGDLGRDGKIDLLVDVSPEYSCRAYRLSLS